jgi:hypothetical protein
MTRRCRRLWEVEAARDGRLVGRALSSFEEHLSSCSDCSGEKRAIERLMGKVRATPPDDEVALRRERERILESAHSAPAQGPGPRPLPRRIALAAAAVVLAAGVWGVTRVASPRPSPIAPTVATAPIASVTASADATWERRVVGNSEQVSLTNGVLDLTVRRSPSGRGVSVLVPDGEIEDVGTVFRVTVAGGRTTEIHVREGSVLFHRPGGAAIRVTSGSTWTPPAEIEPAPPGATPAPVTLPASRKPRAKARATPPQAPAVVASAREEASPADEDVAYLAIVALRRENRSEEARVAAAEYLRKFPRGFRRVEVVAFLNR